MKGLYNPSSENLSANSTLERLKKVLMPSALIISPVSINDTGVIYLHLKN